MDELAELRAGSCKYVDHEEVISFLEGYGLFRPRNFHELQKGRELAIRLIGPDFASLKTFLRVEHYSGIGMLIYHQKKKITGMAGMLMLSFLGRNALLLNKFNGRNPLNEYLARRGEPVFATYVWAGAGITHESRTSIVLVGDGLRRAIFKGVPAFGRAVTKEGAIACEKYLQMKRVGSHAPGLFWHAGSYSSQGKWDGSSVLEMAG